MGRQKIILGIETSCDETSAAVLSSDFAQDGKNNKRVRILSNIISSSALLQSKYGGIIPEQAAREQLKTIIPVIKEALEQAKTTPSMIDAIAVTQGPGLIGSLLVGVETAKVLSRVWNKPLIPVNHLIGHFYANWIEREDTSTPLRNNSSLSEAPRNRNNTTTPQFPCLGLLVSGGHSDLVLFKNHGEYEYLGGTRDDAAGECFDKCARLLGLPYPGGPQISKLAEEGDPKAFKLPRPLSDSGDLDFSFSGLKTAVSNLVNQLTEKPANPEKQSSTQQINWSASQLSDICASIEQAIIDSLINKTLLAIQTNDVEQLIVAGGVAANKKLKSSLELALATLPRAVRLFIPPPVLCTDNAAMIASAAFFIEPVNKTLDIQANPNLSLAY